MANQDSFLASSAAGSLSVGEALGFGICDMFGVRNALRFFCGLRVSM
jgi:hypothetical protein